MKNPKNLDIQWLSPEELIPYENNSKAHPPEQIAKIIRAIEATGFDQYPVVNGDKIIIKGHARTEAAKAAGLKKIPVIVRSDLTPAQERQARISDNRVAESEWLLPELKAELLELQDLDVDLESLGFEVPELEELLSTEEDDGKEDPDKGSSAPPTDEIDPRCKTGEVWQLGSHLLLCGDSLNQKLVALFLKGNGISFVLSDPPYGMNCQNKEGRIGGGSPITIEKRLSKSKYKSKKYLPVVGDDSTDTALASFQLCSELFPDAVQVWWGANHYGVPPSPCWLIWDKQNGETTFADAELAWTNQKTAARIFRHTWNGMIKAGQESGESRCHPNQKPVALAKWIFENYGTPEDCIFDPFAGSGYSFLAAEQLSRRVFGIELFPEYCEIIMLRWEKQTGEEAQRVKSLIEG